MCLARPSRRVDQTLIRTWLQGNQCSYTNILPSGDPLVDRTDDDGITRIGLHNIDGFKEKGV